MRQEYTKNSTLDKMFQETIKDGSTLIPLFQAANPHFAASRTAHRG